MKKKIIAIVKMAPVLALSLASCAHKFTGVDLVRPAMSAHAGPTIFFMAPTKVDSLQPLLEWKPSSESNVTYDVIMYNGVKNGQLWTAGKQVYYRESLSETTHKVAEPLPANTVFCWSVRTRTGTKTSPWSRYSDETFTSLMFSGRARENVLWTFQTPEK